MAEAHYAEQWGRCKKVSVPRFTAWKRVVADIVFGNFRWKAAGLPGERGNAICRRVENLTRRRNISSCSEKKTVFKGRSRSVTSYNPQGGGRGGRDAGGTRRRKTRRTEKQVFFSTHYTPRAEGCRMPKARQKPRPDKPTTMRA